MIVYLLWCIFWIVFMQLSPPASCALPHTHLLLDVFLSDHSLDAARSALPLYLSVTTSSGSALLRSRAFSCNCNENHK